MPRNQEENFVQRVFPQQRQPQGAGHQHTVVVGLQGGLGSQLFEWAFAEELRRRDSRVVIDASQCPEGALIEPLIEGWPRLPKALGMARTVLSRKNLTSRWGGYLVEKTLGYDPAIFEQAQSSRYVVGYFHAPRYFAANSAEIRRKVAAFSAKALTRDGLAVHRYLTQEDGFVAVHVPRAGSGMRHSDADREYLERSWQMLRDQGYRWRVWFGDDLDYASSGLADSGDLFVNSSLTTGPAGEIALMAACRGRILSEDPVSWWGGWLGRQAKQGGAVVAAPRWDADDLFCEGWLAA